MSNDSARLQTDLVRLVDQGRRPDKTLAPRAPAAAIPARAGAGRPSRPPGANDGVGIASPLTETDYNDRVFYSTSTVTSSDGLFTFRVRRLEMLLMDDAGGNRVQFNFQEPVT